MDKFDSLRKSIKQILEQEDQLGRMSPEDYKRLALATQTQTGQDDVEVKDTVSAVDEKVINDILYRNKYKIGYVEYNGLMHLLCVLKVYGQKNPLPQDLKDFIDLVKDYTLGLFDKQQQDLIAASHNISNKNRLVEADSDPVYNLQNHIQIIINHIYRDSVNKNLNLRSDNVANAIKQANSAISSGLGFFTEILFYTYLSNAEIWVRELENFSALQTVFNLHLATLKTSEGTYNASVDFAVMYFLLLDVENKDKKSLHAKLNDYMSNEQWNHRNQDVDKLAVDWSFVLHDPLDHCIEILKKLQNKFSNSKWETGQVEGTNSSHPQYDLWLVEKNNNQTEVIRAKIDIKSYLPNSLIAPTKTSHSSIGKANFFGFINFERKQRPFTETKISNLEYTIKYLIIKEDEVKSLIKKSIQDEEGKTYKDIFVLSAGDPYQLKGYDANDFNTEVDADDLFTLQSYKSDVPYSQQEQTSDSEQEQLVKGDPNFTKYFYMKKIYKNKNSFKKDKDPNFKTIKDEFQKNLTKNFNEKIQNFPIAIIDVETKVNIDRLNDQKLASCLKYVPISHDTTREIVRKLYINSQEVIDILERSLRETVENNKIPVIRYNASRNGKPPTKFTLFNNFIFNTLSLTLNKNFINIIYKDLFPGNQRKHLAIVEVIRYIIEQEYSNNFLVKLNNEYNSIKDDDIGGSGSKETDLDGSTEGDINLNQPKSKFDSSSSNLQSLQRIYNTKKNVDQKDNFTYFVFKPIHSVNGGYKNIFEEFISQYKNEITENIDNSKTDDKDEIEVKTEVKKPVKETLYLNVNNIANSLNEYFNNFINYFNNNNKIFVLKSKNQSEYKSYSFYDALNFYVSYYILQKASKYRNKKTFQSYFNVKSANCITDAILKASGNNSLLFKINKEYQDEVIPYQNNLYDSQNAKRDSHNIKGNIMSEDILRSIIRNILREGDKKKSYRGSHPEESYGWSAKEEDFMFDKPGLTTWEEDRQWVKEYLKSMGMLKNKK